MKTLPPEITRDSTKFGILEALKYNGTMTIDELVERFEISKTAMRAQLVGLEVDSMIARRDVSSEGRGRPPLAFGITERGASVFPSADSALLTQLVAYLEDEGAIDLIRGFFERIWAQRRAEFQSEFENAPSPTFEGRLEILSRLLARNDFMPIVEIETSETMTAVRVRECNCPFPAAVRATRIPCQLEAIFLSEIIGARPIETSLAAKRDETCSFDFELDECERFAATSG